MTPREIEPEDVRVGDRVRLTMEVTFRASRHGGQPVTNIGGVIHTAQSASKYVGPLTLIDRPLPPIPTAEGTVIRHKQSGAVLARTSEGGGRWGEWGYDWMPAGWTPAREDFDVLVPEVLS